MADLDIEMLFRRQEAMAHQGHMDHVFEIMASHNHPVIMVGRSAHRWMGALGFLVTNCDFLIRNSALESIASSLVRTGHWEVHEIGLDATVHPLPPDNNTTDLVLRRTEKQDRDEIQYLSLWSETTYRISVDCCPLVEVPDFYPWHPILVEEKWHPAIDQGGWWYGPRLHWNTKVFDPPETITGLCKYFGGLPRGKSPTNNHTVHVPSLPTYLDALIYHDTHYHHSKPDLASESSWEIRNLTRYLYLELPHQQSRPLIELKEHEYMKNYLQKYVHIRKHCWVRRVVPGNEMELKSVRVKEWDPTSFPEWAMVKERAQI
jgi:hypothetical protein